MLLANFEKLGAPWSQKLTKKPYILLGRSLEYLIFFIFEILSLLPFFLAKTHLRQRQASAGAVDIVPYDHPLFLFLGKAFGFKTIYVIALSSLLFSVLPKYFPNLAVVDPNLDKIMVVLIGGAMESVGIGMILLRGGSTGGTDIVAMILNKYWPISPGKVYLYSDVFIVSSLLLLPQESGGGLVNMIYAYVVMLTFSFGVDYVLLGNKSSVQLLVFSKKYKEIADHIIYDVQRGVTALQSIGWYSQQESKVLLIILRKYQMNEVINEIKRIDKDAFVSVSSANSVYGEGFEEIKTGINIKKKKIEKPEIE